MHNLHDVTLHIYLWNSLTWPGRSAGYNEYSTIFKLLVTCIPHLHVESESKHLFPLSRGERAGTKMWSVKKKKLLTLGDNAENHFESKVEMKLCKICKCIWRTLDHWVTLLDFCISWCKILTGGVWTECKLTETKPNLGWEHDHDLIILLHWENFAWYSTVMDFKINQWKKVIHCCTVTCFRVVYWTVHILRYGPNKEEILQDAQWKNIIHINALVLNSRYLYWYHISSNINCKYPHFIA